MVLTNKNIIGFSARTRNSIRPSRGNENSVSTALFDLSERQQTEKYQHWLSMIVESSSDAVIGKSLDGIILSWNEAAERLFGYSAMMVTGQPVSMLFAAEDAEDVQALVARSGCGEHIDSHETEGIRQDGQRILVSLTLSPIKNRTGTIVGVATIARAITERPHTQDQLPHLAPPDRAFHGYPRANSPLY